MRTALALLLALSSTIVAQADEPATPPASTNNTAPAPTPPASTSTATPAPTPPASTSATTDPKADLEAKKTAAMAELKKNGFSGYKTKLNKDGSAVYCRKEQQIGTRFETENCRSLQALIQDRENGKNYMNTVQQQGLEGRASN